MADNDIDVISSSDSGQEATSAEDEKDLSTLSSDEESESSDEKVDESSDEKSDEKEENLDKELEDFEKDKIDVKDDVVQEIRRPALRKIMAKYPNIDKEFPDIKHVFHREQKFSEICGTVDDAKEMAEKSETFDVVNSELGNGNIPFFLNALTEQTRTNFAKEFLPTLYKHDKAAFHKATQPLLVSLMNRAYASFGNDDKDQNVINGRNSVLNVCNYLFGKRELPTFDSDEVVDPKVAKEREELNKEKGNLYLQQYNSFRSGIQEFAENKLLSEIVGHLDNSYSDFQKSAIANAILDDIDAELSNDSLHNSTMSSLWKRTEKENLNPKWRSQIIAAYLGRARQTLPTLIKKYIAKGKSNSETGEKVPSRNLATTGREKLVDKKINPRDTRRISDFDLINSK